MQRADDGLNLWPDDGIIDGCSLAAGLDKSIRSKPHELLRHRHLLDLELLTQFGDRLFSVHQGTKNQKPLRMRQAAHQHGSRLSGWNHFSYIHSIEFISFECYVQAAKIEKAQSPPGDQVLWRHEKWSEEAGIPAPTGALNEGRPIMTIDRAVLMFAGVMVLVSLGLGFYVSAWWYLLTVFVGLNLIQASITGFCPAAMLFKKLGCPAGVAFK